MHYIPKTFIFTFCAILFLAFPHPSVAAAEESELNKRHRQKGMHYTPLNLLNSKSPVPLPVEAQIKWVEEHFQELDCEQNSETVEDFLKGSNCPRLRDLHNAVLSVLSTKAADTKNPFLYRLIALNSVDKEMSQMAISQIKEIRDDPSIDKQQQNTANLYYQDCRLRLEMDMLTNYEKEVFSTYFLNVACDNNRTTHDRLLSIDDLRSCSKKLNYNDNYLAEYWPEFWLDLTKTYLSLHNSMNPDDVLYMTNLILANTYEDLSLLVPDADQDAAERDYTKALLVIRMQTDGIQRDRARNRLREIGHGDGCSNRDIQNCWRALKGADARTERVILRKLLGLCANPSLILLDHINALNTIVQGIKNQEILIRSADRIKSIIQRLKWDVLKKIENRKLAEKNAADEIIRMTAPRSIVAKKKQRMPVLMGDCELREEGWHKLLERLEEKLSNRLLPLASAVSHPHP
ncbi:MAG: hypothetical protein NTX76_04035 [Alphaproteobacteria bacterium]|nr:hypothetical protein [Alphaproteobacteria bacterium]